MRHSITRPIWAAVLFLFAFSSTAQAQTLLRDAEIEQFLRDYTNPLLEAAGLEPHAVGLHIIGDNSLNAFVTAGTNMFVHTGLIMAADKPNQIEGVLAHETGHLMRGDQQRGAEAYAKASRPAMLSLVLGAVAVAAGAPEAGIGLIGLGQNVALGEYLSYSQGAEGSTDEAAVVLLREVNRPLDGLAQFFDILANKEYESGNSSRAYLRTHPLSSKRRNAILSYIPQQSPDVLQDTEEDIERLQMIQAKIFGFMNPPDVTIRKYGLARQDRPARYARAVAYYRDSRLDKATIEIDRLLTDEPENPFFHELKGQMLFELSRPAESVAPHRRSVELAPQYALLKINLARALIALGRREEAEEGIALLNVALVSEPQNVFAWQELARAYGFLENIPMAALSQAQSCALLNNPAQAHRFATLASRELEPGSPAHLRALDIINLTQDDARKLQNRPQSQRRC